MLPFLSFLNGNHEDLNASQFIITIFFGISISFFVFLSSIIIKQLFKTNNKDFFLLLISISTYILFVYRVLDINKIVYLIMFFTLPFSITYFVSKSINFKKIFSVSIFAMFIISATQVAINYIFLNSEPLTRKDLQPIYQKTVSDKPNIYFFMLDEYSRSDELLKLGIDNSYFINYLSDKSFYVADQSVSNFMATHYSLQALYSMEYPNLISDDFHLRKNILQGNNKVIKTLKSLGYYHVRMGPNQATNTDCSGIEDHCLFKINDFDGTAYGYGSIYLNLIKMTPLYGIIQRTFPKPFSRDVYKKSTIKNALNEWKKYKKKIPSPLFVELNVWQPHAPYIYDRECELVKDIMDYDLDFNKSKKDLIKAIKGYRGEVHCVNRQVMEFVNFINNTDPNAIVIILSDTGSSFGVDSELIPKSWTNTSIKTRSSNLWAVKLPEECKNVLYPKISLVNTFRIVFSCIYKEEIILLRDKIHVHDRYNFTFHEIQVN